MKYAVQAVAIYLAIYLAAARLGLGGLRIKRDSSPETDPSSPFVVYRAFS